MKLLEYDFSDLYITINKEFYITDEKYDKGVKKVSPEDKDKFCDYLKEKHQNKNTFSINYDGTIFRVEYTQSIKDSFYCLRRMPLTVPNIHSLGFDEKFVKYMLSLSKASGLILWSGSTGSGKTTSISSLLQEYLNLVGGFAYTIEDPVELPLENEYKAFNGTLGLCRQIEVKDDNWSNPLKSALRSNPRYILIGEIRTTESAVECLRASISGHLVLSTIHSNSVVDALGSLVKYALGGMSEAAAYDTCARGLLVVVKQDLISDNGTKQPHIETLFANPDVNAGCSVRNIIASGNLNLASQQEQQFIRLQKGVALFK